MQEKIVLIVPHFGRFNNYFNLWLHSCKYNPTINWLIFTDDRTSYNYPPNVKVHYTTFSEVVKRIQGKFDFEVELRNPYQLCEFKVTYGEVFEEFIGEYDFWGHCDTDVIWGNLREHISTEILSAHSKISWRGHLTLYRNDTRINGLYRSEIDGTLFYKYALSNNTGFPLAFDERVINSIFVSRNEEIYTKLLFADLKIRSFNFFLLHFSPENDYKNDNQIFEWNAGNLYRYYLKNGQICKESFAYVHFLKREMQLASNFKFNDRFLIVPNKFINEDDEVDAGMIRTFSKQRFYWKYLFSRLTVGYLTGKISYFTNKQKFKKKYSHLPHKATPFQIPAS